MIRNDTPTTFRLRVAVGGEFLEGEWLADRPAEYSYRVVERDHCIRSEWWGGYSRHNALYREVYDAAGHCVDVQPVTRNDALMMYAPLLPDTEAEQGRRAPGARSEGGLQRRSLPRKRDTPVGTAPAGVFSCGGARRHNPNSRCSARITTMPAA